jgi:hypothetical protein
MSDRIYVVVLVVGVVVVMLLLLYLFSEAGGIERAPFAR